MGENDYSCSVAQPPRAMHAISKNCSFVKRRLSLGTCLAKPSAAVPLGTILTFSKGSACSKNQPQIAWPYSCNATILLSSLLIACLERVLVQKELCLIGLFIQTVGKICGLT